METSKLWSSIEINANLLDVEVHILGYAFDIKHCRMKPYLQQPTFGKAYQLFHLIYNT
ncbi:PHP family metal-dependent phosphoesterase [Richelia intracellularis HM01]|uniref:hypothetical protein n=1 Tax=Richelia intracellularis TaxID=1164990 RepID=UPI0002B542D0|nr:hypothetical protein [Richelia intracellularis]CCH65126.1 PHP family metal-dependent phosphoesterase [Richelia intracellularis HM01]